MVSVTAFCSSYRRVTLSGDPIVCGGAVILAMPFLYCTLIFSKDQLIVTWVLIFLAETALCSTWALITDMLMVEFFIEYNPLSVSFQYIIIPSRRSTASSIQIFVLHLFVRIVSRVSQRDFLELFL